MEVSFFGLKYRTFVFIVRVSYAYIVFSVFEICKMYENTHIYIVMGCNFRVCLVRL